MRMIRWFNHFGCERRFLELLRHSEAFFPRCMWRQARCARAKQLQAHVGAMSLLSPGDKHMPGDDLPSPVTSFSIALVGLWIRDIIGKPSHTNHIKREKGHKEILIHQW